MYVPPLEALLRFLNIRPDNFESTGLVQVPASLLKMLLQLAVAHCDFNEEDYFEQNPDVKDAVKLGRVENGFIHYIGFGYFEGRRGGIPAVDESWYLNKYPDVAAGVRAGAINGAKDHFYNIGAAEGRSPNSDNESEALRWKQAIKP